MIRLMNRALVVLILVLVAVAVTGLNAPTAPAEDGLRQERVRLHQAVRDLPVGREVRRGYDRDKFEHWVDADDNCRDTRDDRRAVSASGE